MAPPTKCESTRRAIINVDNLADLAALSSETTILFREFNHACWRWNVVVSHDVLPMLAPGYVCVQYMSVAVFNRMIEQQIAKAIAGELAAEADPSLGAFKTQLQQYAQGQQLGLTQPSYTNVGAQASPGWTTSTGTTGGLSQLSQSLGLLLPPPTGSTTP